MELIKKDKKWFLSEEGGKKFVALKSVGERAVFIYSYLKNITNKDFDENNQLFKTAFLLADAVYGSKLTYSEFPALLDEGTNPFIAFLTNTKFKCTDEQLYCIYLSIVHNIADPFNKNEWIYKAEMFKDNNYMRKIEELGHEFVIPNKRLFVEPDAYKSEEKYNDIQLEIIWLFQGK